jgi:hypothetical protein
MLADFLLARALQPIGFQELVDILDLGTLVACACHVFLRSMAG